ncbi:MAG: Holliday junction branch migration DNA helicase RuvB [Candidatus Wallbacteria bacterium]|nr:Holliday junction branch migration DNA helicase RuvB [Candidatus Wallbacteria bacterium]
MAIEERLVSPEPQPVDTLPGAPGLRPKSLDEFIGQEDLKRRLRMHLTAARQRGDALDHVLLAGPAGLGKTTLAHIVAREMGANFHVTSGPAIQRSGDLASVLSNLQKNDVLFLDEIHRISRPAEEVLYTAMEDFHLDIMMGKGPAARTLRLPLPPFTLIGATTRSGLLTPPLRDRFGISANLAFYSDDDLLLIVRRGAALLGLELDGDGAAEIARRTRGTPRVALRVLKNVRDVAQVRSHGIVNRQVAREALELLQIDDLGLDPIDRRLMDLLVNRYHQYPVGVETLAVSLGEQPDTISEVIEPFLIKIGLLVRTPRGRQATPEGMKRFGGEGRVPVGEQPTLFDPVESSE